MSRVVVTSRSFSSGAVDLVARLEAEGHEVVRAAPHHGLDDLRESLSEAVAWIAGTGPVGPDQLALAPHLRVIARYGVGHDAVDLAAAQQRDIIVTNTPGANSDAVADHALALTLSAIRAVVDGDRRVRRGDWSTVRGREIGSAVVGVVGFGRIGRGVAQRFAGFGARVVVHDPYVADDAVRAVGCEPLRLDELMRTCDIVSLHLPGGSFVVDDAVLADVKQDLVLVNTSRADLVDEEALAAALRDGRLAAYAADTLSAEGVDSDSPLLSDALAARVVVTPHLGAQTTEAIDRMGSMAVDDVLAVLDGRRPSHPVTPMKENA